MSFQAAPGPVCSHLAGRLACDGQEEFELGWELVLGVQPVREVDSANTAVRMDLNSKRSKIDERFEKVREVTKLTGHSAMFDNASD